MSTRRARIKAVTSLPPRRKNAETAESRNKVSTSKDVNTSNSRTPTQSASASKEGDASTFVKNTLELQNTCNKTPSKETSTKENFPVINNTTPIETTQSANTSILLHTDKVQPINLIKNLNVFASPLSKGSPKKTFVSPTLPSPKVLKNLDQKLHNTHVSRKTPIAQKIYETNELQITGNIVNITHNNISNQNAREEYILPCNINEEAMDGIVPLQSTTTAPKPIEILKSEIISENAEVLFDPIIPLPSPSKVRPKLRPAPRLGPHRRNSVQGSASESEDESRRSLLSTGGNTPAPRQRHDSQISHSTFVSLPNRDVSRVRNDSVCSGVSLITKQAPASPVKEKHTKRSRNDRRLNAMRRRENVKRDALTMYDLIFYNPTSNPIIPDEEEINAKEANEKDAIERAKKAETKEPEPPKETAAPVPQIKLGPKGEIIIDEESLVIKQTDSDRKVSSVVHEGSWATGGYRAKHCRSRDWTPAETVRFYRALAVIGTDFSLMAPLFPDRTRRELKFKFKKEEKTNGAQVDKALRSTIEWDVLRLKEEFKEERALAAKQAEKERQLLLEEKRVERERLKAARETRVRSSRGSKALSSNTLPGANKIQPDIYSVDGIIERAAKRPPRKKAKQTPDTDNVNQNIPKDLSLVNAYEADFATLTRLPHPSQMKPPEIISTLPPIPSNIETGSLVVLTVNDPSSPAKKMLQTYIARGPGQLTPVALPTTFLNSVVGYMKKNNKGPGSPQIISPNSVTSHDSRTSGTGISMLPSPAKRQRHSSFTITQL